MDPAAIIEPYRVLEVRSGDGARLAPPEIGERFEGRTFSLHELEQRGVRISGRRAWYLAAGRDWQLILQAVTDTTTLRLQTGGPA